jgi:hypothetical protein
MIQQGNVREGADTTGRNNPAAAWPDFGTAKTYESQLAEAKQRLAEAESRYVLYFNGKPASHYATEAEAKRIADSIKAKHPTVKIEIKNEMHEGNLTEVTGDLPFDTMLSKIVAGGNLQTLAAKIVAKIKKFPQHVESDGYERDMPRYPDGHFYGADVLNDTFDEVMQQWKKMGPDNFSDEYGEESLFDVLDGSADYTRYWDGILKLRDRLQSMPGAVEQLGKMVWHGLFSGNVEQGITDIGKPGVAEGLDEAVGGNYLYHATGSNINDLKNIISNGLITNASNQERTGSKLRALSFTRNWRYALTTKDDDNQETTGIANGVIFVVDQSILKQKNKMQSVDRPADIINEFKAVLAALPTAESAMDLFQLIDGSVTPAQLAALSQIAGSSTPIMNGRQFISAVAKPYLADKTNQQALANAQSNIIGNISSNTVIEFGTEQTFL